MLAAVGLLAMLAAAAAAARCTGSPNCRACSNCSSCGHCKAGGTCGVCATSADPEPAPELKPEPSGAERDAQRQRERLARLAKRAREDKGQKGTESEADAESEATNHDGTRPAIQVYFSPGTEAVAAIVAEIRGAEAKIDIQAYRLTSTKVVKALLDAHKRGVTVRVVLDGRQQSAKYSDATIFHNAGVPTFVDAEHPIAHNKVILIDDRTVITGSYNFSANAERNAENLLVIRDATLAATYQANFEEHLEHAERYKGLAAPVKKQAPKAGEAETEDDVVAPR